MTTASSVAAKTTDSIFLNNPFSPIRYDLHINPDYSTCGSHRSWVSIEISQPAEAKPFSTFRIHADSNLDLDMSSCYIIQPSGRTNISGVENIKELDKIITFKLESPVDASQEKTLLIMHFTGKIIDNMQGFYRSTVDAKAPGLLDRYLFSTQFEALDARAAFPCFDEPAQKAIFGVTISVPAHEKDLVVLSNMPLKRPPFEEKNEKFNEPRLIHEFADSPRMSTYLLAWSIGRLECVETKKDNVLLRAWTTPGKKAQAVFGLEVAKKSLRYFEEFFEIPFPLEKLDLLAMPDFAAGAMENWGLITFREIALLVCPATSFARRNAVASIVAHEVGHMWFGNLVTMQWWDDLWLNEGFATFVMYEAAAAALDNPLMLRSLLDNRSQSAYANDALRCVRPVRQALHRTDEIRQMFDSMRYAKSGTVLRMLANWVGRKRLGLALKAYLTKYAYGNATAAQLFAVLEKELKMPVTKMMDSFVNQPGVPLVTISGDASSGLTATQERFLYNPCDDKKTWTFPLFFSEGSPVLVQEHTQKVDVHSAMPGLANWEESGYFRVQVSESAIAALQGPLPPATLLKLMRDQFALFKARRVSMRELERVFDLDKTTVDGRVFELVAGVKHFLDLSDKDQATQFAQRRASNLSSFDEVLTKLENSEDPLALFSHSYSEEENKETRSSPEIEEKVLLAKSVLNLGYLLGEKRTLRFLANLTTVTSDFRTLSVKYQVAYKFELPAVLEEYLSPSASPEEKSQIVAALGVVTSNEQALKVIEFAADSKGVRLQDRFAFFVVLASTGNYREVVLRYLEDHPERIPELFGEGFLISRIVGAFASLNCEADKNRLEALFNSNRHVTMELERTSEKIDINIAFAKWFAEQNAAEV